MKHILPDLRPRSLGMITGTVAPVLRQVADVVIVITEPIGEEEPEPRPMAVVLHMAM